MNNKKQMQSVIDSYIETLCYFSNKNLRNIKIDKRIKKIMNNPVKYNKKNTEWFMSPVHYWGKWDYTGDCL